jgi:hypothetical protein
LLLGVIGAMTVGISNLPIAATAKESVCEFTDTNQECNLKIKKLNVDDDFNLKIINGGGSGGGGTVDQEARDGVAELKSKDVTQDSDLSAAQATIQSLNATLTQTTSDNAAQDAKIAELEATLANISAITDISLETGTGVIVPPPDNQTEPVTCLPSQFFNETSGACQDIVVIEPGNGNVTEPTNGNVTEPVDNQTNGGNETNGNGGFENATSFGSINIGELFTKITG